VTVAQVRTIIADPHQFGKSEAEGDGVVLSYQLDNAPVFESTINAFVDGVLQTLTTDYTVDEATGLIHFVAPPADGAVIVVTYEFALLHDDDIQFFLDLNDDNVRRAAADALDTIASSEVLIQKRITLLDLKTEGDGVAKSLREHAKRLRDADNEASAENDTLFDYAEMALPPFNRRRLWWKQHGRDL
jgi:hypothetical protein